MLRVLLLGLVASGICWGVAHAEQKTPSPLGRKIDDFSLADFRGRIWSLAEFADRKLVVVLFTGTECPLANAYAPRIEELHQKYSARGVALMAIDANQQDSLTEMAQVVKQHKLTFPFLKDPGNKIANQFGAERTPEVFVLDGERKVRYRGRIDDQFAYGKQRPKVQQNYLIAAIDELLVGKEVSQPEVEALGCHIGRLLQPKAESAVTYSRQISRILQKRCVECHRPGEIGPFSLLTYEDAVGWAEMIAEVVAEERMPPWHANPAHGKFANDARLNAAEKEQIRQWFEAGAPEGDPAELPSPRTFVEGWQIGTPDKIVAMSEKPFDVPATGTVRYQYFAVDPGFKEDTWVQAAECRPGNRAIVHHIIVLLQTPEGQRSKFQGELHSEWLTATAPGAKPLILPPGQAKLIPAGSKLVFQMHYTPNGTAQSDLSHVGLKFADPQTVQKQVGTHQAAEPKFFIPPGANNHKVEAWHTFAKDSLILSMFPHMHLRGKAFRYTAVYPDGKQEILLDIPRYDFNWQNGYALAEPLRLPAGSKMHCEAWFDNSAENFANPDPTKGVRWGDQTWEEMMIGYFDMALADQDLTQPSERRTDQFLKAQSPIIDDELKAIAAKALESNRAWMQLGLALRKRVPQLDRVCWTVPTSGKLEVRRCAQEPALEKLVGGAGHSVTASLTIISSYAEREASISHPKLAGLKPFDLAHMARAYGSSLHIPATVDGSRGTLNFWSVEEAGFPPEAEAFLKQIPELLKK